MNELDLIRWIRQQVGASPAVAVGIGDDCAALRMPAGKVLLVTTDMVIAGVHFDPRTASAAQVGHKAMARGLSDIAAMAGDALAVVVALAAPRGMDSKYFQELFLGMKSVADAFGVQIVGGDIASGDLPLTLTVTALGAGDEDRAGAPVRRAAGRPGARHRRTRRLDPGPASFLPAAPERGEVAARPDRDSRDGGLERRPGRRRGTRGRGEPRRDRALGRSDPDQPRGRRAGADFRGKRRWSTR